jgi:hypothetical protein
MAAYAEKVGGYLRGKDPDQLLHDVEDLGRRKPWAAGGTGLVLGLAASRFMKASSRQRYAARSAQSPRPQTDLSRGVPDASADVTAGGSLPSPAVPGASAPGVPPVAPPLPGSGASLPGHATGR